MRERKRVREQCGQTERANERKRKVRDREIEKA